MFLFVYDNSKYRHVEAHTGVWVLTKQFSMGEAVVCVCGGGDAWFKQSVMS